VGPRVGLDRCGKSHPHRDSIPGPSSPYPVAIPTELPGPLSLHLQGKILPLYVEDGSRMLLLNYDSYLQKERCHNPEDNNMNVEP
jgi:hypothetical protein